MNTTARYLVYGIIFIAAFAISASLLGDFFPKDRVVSPHIDPAMGQSAPLIASHTFPFEQSLITVSVPVNSSVYYGAHQADKGVEIYGNISENIWLADSYRAMIADPAQDSLYRDLTGQFRQIRAEKNLTSDEYLELMALYVQSLRYETLPENPAKFPVETVMEGSGDCDDKSLLLAGLLSHEGYRVALFSFGPEAHMAVGVGSSAYLYKNTGYAFLETTNFSYVGVPTTRLETGELLRSDPVVIPVGNGGGIYQSGNETWFIQNASDLAGKEAAALEPQVIAAGQELAEKHERIAELENTMAAIKNSGNWGQYNAQVPIHNAMVNDYNTEMASYRGTLTRYQEYSDLHNYVLLNVFDRKEVFDYVRKNYPV